MKAQDVIKFLIKELLDGSETDKLIAELWAERLAAETFLKVDRDDLLEDVKNIMLAFRDEVRA